MNCDQFKDLLLTDFVDNVLDEARKKDCLVHMSQCQDCQKIVSDLRAIREKTFEVVQSVEPPEHVWELVTEKIQSSRRWSEKFQEFLTLPRLSFAIPVLACLLIFMVLQINSPKPSYDGAPAYLVEELASDFNVLSNEDIENGNFGTVIEDFFM